VYPDNGQGTAETCRDVLNKIATVRDIKLDIYIYICIHVYILYFMMHGNTNIKYKIFPDIVNEIETKHVAQYIKIPG
jgi:hypothetical protein